MSWTKRVGLKVPRREWELVEDCIKEKRRLKTRYIQNFIEEAMRYRLGENEDGIIERLLETLADLLSHSIDGFSEMFYSFSDRMLNPDSVDSLPSDWYTDTKKIEKPVDAELLDRFKAWADAESDYTVGYELGRALREHRLRSQLKRNTEKLQTIIAAVVEGVRATSESDESEAADQDVHYNDVDVTNLDRRTQRAKCIKVCQALDPDQDQIIDREMVTDAVQDVLGFTQGTAEDYVEPVIERLGFVEHPKPTASDVYVHPDRYEELKGHRTDAYKEIDEMRYSDLSDHEVLEKIRLDLAKNARSKNKAVRRCDYEFVAKRLGSDVTNGQAHKRMHAAADGAAGYRIVKAHGGQRIEVDLWEVDPALREYLGLEAIGNDDESGESGSEENEDVEAQMDNTVVGQQRIRKEAAQHAITDGGTDDIDENAAGPS